MTSDRLSDSVGTAVRGRNSFSIARDFVEPLRALGSESDHGLFAILLAVFCLLLLRHLGSDDLVVAGRNREGNTLLLRIGLPDDPTFLDLLDRVRDAVRSTCADPGSITLLEITSCKTLLIFSAAPVETDSAQYDLVIGFTESEQGLLGSCEYNADQFEDAQASALTRHFEILLKEAATRPGARISSFEMLDAGEKHRILIEWNGKAREYLPHCVHELFERQVGRTPDSIAVMFEGRNLTYRELNGRANQLAHYLRRRGTGPEVLVGVLMDASLEIAIAIIAISKAGGACLVLNHDQSEHRIREIIRESRISLAVTSASNLGYQAIAGEVEFVCVDLEASRIAAESSSNPCSGVTPNNIAAVRYTSGSTGNPKGVVSIHRSTASRLISLPLPDIAAADVYLLNGAGGLAGRWFDPLLLGATAVIVPEKDFRDVNRLTDSLERYAITRISIVPSHLRQLLDIGPDISRRLERLRAVSVGGETLTADLAARFEELLPHARLTHSYGSSELGGRVAMQPIGGDSLDTGNSIGRPVANIRIYLLDRDMNPVPQGTVGEMYVGSGHMCRGYLNRPDLTAARFVPDPFGPCPGGRLYRTGDLGRHLPDGRIKFVGRVDRQVKIRGNRIELEEIEAVLHDTEQVQQAFVMSQNVRTQEAGSNKRLVAYLVPKAGANPGVGLLQSILRQRLPDYMVPAAFVFLDQMPLTRNGKVDVQALPAPGPERPRLDSIYEAPRTSTEASIAEIWREVLGVESIGINDNFVELGGDSLLAASVAERLRKRLGLDVPVELVLEWSIAAITKEMNPATTAGAASILQAQGSLTFRSLVPIQPSGDLPPLFCIHGLSGAVFSLRELGRSLGPDQPVYGLRSVGLEGTQPNQIRIEEMAVSYLREMRAVQPEGPYYLCGYCFGGVVALEIARQLTAVGEQIAFLAIVTGVALKRLNRNSVRNTGFIPNLLRHARRHLRAWSPMPARAKLSYIRSRFFSRIFPLLIEAAYKAHFPAAAPIPPGAYPVEEAHKIALKRYRPLPCASTVTLFRAGPHDSAGDPSLGWAAIAPNGLDIDEIPGTHTTALRQPHVKILAATLSDRLRVARERTGAPGTQLRSPVKSG